MTDPIDQIPDDLIDMRQAARVAKANIATVYRWALSGRLRCWKRAGRRFVSRAELLSLFVPVQSKNGRVPPAQAALTRRQQEAQTRRILQEHGLA